MGDKIQKVEDMNWSEGRGEGGEGGKNAKDSECTCVGDR